MNSKSCVIIGAGLSGLAAAHILTKENWEVTILEAESFIGGRVYSFQFPQAPELVCELGGEWIGKDHHNVIKLCDEFGLKRIPHQFDYFFFEKGKKGRQYRAGQWPFPPRATRDFKHLKKQVARWNRKQRIVLDKKDWWTILRDRGFDECDLLRRDLMDSTDFGESIRGIGGYSAAAEYFYSDRFDEMDTKVAGGNARLVRALEKAVTSRGGKILTSHSVTTIIQTRQRRGCEDRKLRRLSGEILHLYEPSSFARSDPIPSQAAGQAMGFGETASVRANHEDRNSL